MQSVKTSWKTFILTFPVSQYRSLTGILTTITENLKSEPFMWILKTNQKLYTKVQLCRLFWLVVITKINRNKQKIVLTLVERFQSWVYLQKRRYKLTVCFALIGWGWDWWPVIGQGDFYYRNHPYARQGR